MLTARPLARIRRAQRHHCSQFPLLLLTGALAGLPSMWPGDATGATPPTGAVSRATVVAPAQRTASTGTSLAGGSTPTSRTEVAAPRAFILLEEPVVPAGDTPAAEVARVIVQVARSRLAATDGVTLRTGADLPDAAANVRRHGDLTRLERPALVALRVATGFDGVVVSEVRSEGGVVLTVLRYVDLGNGRVLRVRTLQGAVTAALFAQLEADLDELAASLRQTYRVTLHVASSPPDAQVRLNGALACRTPCTKELADGEYTVQVEKADHRSWRHTGFYKSGDRVHLEATLYNPVADRYLNRAPAFRLDSQALNLGYRYAFFNVAKPALRELHYFTLDYLLRFADFEAGVGLRASGSADATTLVPTFVANEPLQRTDGIRAFAPMATFKWRVFEKFSFLTLWAGASLGFDNLRTGNLAQWSFAGDAFAQLTSRIGRSKNFSFELVLDLGFTYAGELPYLEKQITVFGDGPERTRLQPLLGVFAGVALRFVGWNDIF